jgi:hypothetical protein
MFHHYVLIIYPRSGIIVTVWQAQALPRGGNNFPHRKKQQARGRRVSQFCGVKTGGIFMVRIDGRTLKGYNDNEIGCFYFYLDENWGTTERQRGRYK